MSLKNWYNKIKTDYKEGEPFESISTIAEELLRQFNQLPLEFKKRILNLREY